MRLFHLLTFASTVLAQARTSAPSGAVVVAKSGGKFTTIQAALNSGAKSIFIMPGTYNEQVTVSQPGVTIYGYTTDASSYSGNQATITGNRAQDTPGQQYSNDQTATLQAHGANFKLYNVNVANTRGKGSQAVAVSATADQQGYYGCQFTGFQDTVLSNDGHHVFGKSLIRGATDFIFGQRAASWFESCSIQLMGASTGYITANGRDSSSNPSNYVIHKSNIAAAPGQSVPAGAYYLGRPWRNYARVTFQQSSLSNAINGAGWAVWGSSDTRTDHVSFGEYGNSGAGASGTRAGFAKKLGSPVGIDSVLGSGWKGWVDGKYVSG